MKNVFIILLTILCIKAQAQHNESVIVMGAEIGLSVAQFPGNHQITGTGYTKGLDIEIPVFEDFSIGSGLRVTTYGEQNSFTRISPAIEINPSFRLHRYEHKYIVVPFNIKYRFKFMYLKAEMQPHFLTPQTALAFNNPTISTETKEFHMENLRNFNVALNLAAGVNFHLTRNLRFKMQPSIGYMLLPAYTKDTPNDKYGFLIGMVAGIQYAFIR